MNNNSRDPIPSLYQIKAHCEKQGIKLTPLRVAVLSILCDEKKPLTAYAILDELKKHKSNAQVMSVYRILDYLQENHLIHRIENLNAYRLCCQLNHDHFTQWLICETCGLVSEHSIPAFEQGIKKITAQTGFSVAASTIELKGTCERCLEANR